MRHVLPYIYNKVGHAVDCNRDKMFRKLFLVSLFAFVALAPAFAQKKEISQAKSAIKAGKAVEAEASMRKLLADSAHRQNEKIWLVLFDAVKNQYEDVNEKMYLKQSTDTAKLFDVAYRMFGVLEALDSVDAMPDKDGRIKLKYRRKHADYLDAYRKNLYTGGSYFLNKQDYPRAFKLFAAYIDCASQPLFETQQYASRDKRLPSAAFYALYSGYRANDAAATLRYKQLAETDTARLPLRLRPTAHRPTRSAIWLRWRKVSPTTLRRVTSSPICSTTASSVATPFVRSMSATVRSPRTPRARWLWRLRAPCCSP